MRPFEVGVCSDESTKQTSIWPDVNDFSVISAALIDPLDFCMSVLQEDRKHPLSPKKDASDLRLKNFNVLKNRISYVFNTGPNVISVVEKCISNFFEFCPEANKIGFSEKGNICSLSNGPGIDIVGYLSALYKFKKQLNCFPSLKIINSFLSWENVFQKVASFSYKEYCKNSNISYNDLPPENVQLIPCDIFENLSKQAENCIKECEVLLVTSVLTLKLERFFCTLEKIFQLLKPGSLVFYIAGIGNVKRMCKIVNLNYSLDLLYGPLKVHVKELPPEQRNNKHPLYQVRFIVLQKKLAETNEGFRTLHGAIPKSKHRKKSKNKVPSPLNVSFCEEMRQSVDMLLESSISPNNSNDHQMIGKMSLDTSVTHLFNNLDERLKFCEEHAKQFVQSKKYQYVDNVIKQSDNTEDCEGKCQTNASFDNIYIPPHKRPVVKDTSFASTPLVQNEMLMKSSNDTYHYEKANNSAGKKKFSESLQDSLPSVPVSSNSFFHIEEEDVCQDKIVQKISGINFQTILTDQNQNATHISSCFNDEIGIKTTNQIIQEKLTETANKKMFVSPDRSVPCSDLLVDRGEKDMFYSILHNWESRISSLEKLVADINSDMSILKQKLIHPGICCSCKKSCINVVDVQNA